LKIIKYLILILITILFAYEFVPIKFAIEVNGDSLKKVNHKKDEVVYICELTQTTGPMWEVVGDENGLFDAKIDNEQVIIDEVILPFLLKDYWSYLYEKRKFVIKGKIIDRRKDSISDPILYKVLKVNKWYVEYPIERDYYTLFPSKRYLSLSDIDWLGIYHKFQK